MSGGTTDIAGCQAGRQTGRYERGGGSLTGLWWCRCRTLSDEAKAPFKAQAQLENEEYKQQMRQWHRGEHSAAAHVRRDLMGLRR